VCRCTRISKFFFFLSNGVVLRVCVKFVLILLVYGFSKFVYIFLCPTHFDRQS